MITQQTPQGVFGICKFPSVCVYLCLACVLYVRVTKALYRFSLLRTWNRGFTCGWTWAMSFLGLCGLQTNSVSHISLTVRSRGAFRSCCSLLCLLWITRGLWSHLAAVHFAGKERDDVMLLAPHQHALIRCAMQDEKPRSRCNNNTSTVILWGIIFFSISMITATSVITLCIYSIFCIHTHSKPL